MPLSAVASKYNELRQELPVGYAQLARECQAFQRARVVTTPDELLYLVLLYSVEDLSLRDIAGVSTGSGTPLSDEAIRQRLAACPQWLERLVGKLLPPQALPPGQEAPWQVVICDGSQISGPGAQGTDYRWHAAYDPVAQRVQDLQVTDVHTGESFSRFTWGLGQIVLGDRNFAKAPAVFAMRASGAHVVVRMTPQYLKLWGRKGEPFDLVAALQAAGRQVRVSFALALHEAKSEQVLPVWIHALHLNEQQCNRARRRAKRQARRRGRTPRAQTLFLSEWILVLTTLPPSELSPQEILELYRIRWQVGVSSQGSLTQSVQVRPRLTDSSLVAREAPGRESNPVKPSDNLLGREWAQRSRLQRAVNAEVASLHATPVAEPVYYVRRQQGPGETSPQRRSSPAGYQR